MAIVGLCVSLKKYDKNSDELFEVISYKASYVNIINFAFKIYHNLSTIYSLNVSKSGAKNEAILSQIAKEHFKHASTYMTYNHSNIPYVILIIGESASRYFMGAYGFELNNTPYLSKLLKEGELFLFDNVNSPMAHTLYVFQTLLNFSDYENRNTAWYLQMDLPDVLKMAGYKTYWFSNQADMTLFITPQSIIAQRADKKNIIGYSTNPLFDQYLPILYKHHQTELEGNKQFIVFHLMGSHLDYKDRYPKTFDRFKPQDINKSKYKVANNHDLEIIAQYVNSIYYTDYVLKQIFDLFKDKDALVFYLSDHAQDIFQGRNGAGHMCDDYGVSIPFMIYTTPLFIKNHPEKIELIKKAIHKPFMSDDLIQSLLPLIDIKTTDNIESKNIFSTMFDEKRKRIYCWDKEYGR